MTDHFVVHGARGAGSVPIEAALTLMGLPYEVVERPPLKDFEAALAAAAKVNPMRQIPAVVLPGGELMTESAAILIWLADAYPQAGLAPPSTSPLRPAFLRWMTFVSAAIYGLYWIRDDPSRMTPDKALEPWLRERTADRIAECWGIMEAQVSPGRYLLGDEMSVLDLFVATISRWGPRRRRFYEVAPRMGEVVRRIDADPRLAGFWAERFPFSEGWEG